MGARALLATSVLASTVLALACDPTPNAAAGTAPKGGDCATCHAAEYQSAATPLHVGQKPKTCGVCHSQEGWHPALTPIQHEFWPLTGKHPNAECSWCHKGAPAVMKGPSKDCVSCHKPEFDESPYPGHATFGTKCADCHTTNGFKPAKTYPPPPKISANPVSAASGGKLVPLKLPPGSNPQPRGGAGTVTSSGGVGPSPATPAPITPPAAPTTRPPPDVTSRSSPRRR